MKIAMIMAAGRGERLNEITKTLPKALCMVKGKPLIEHHVINLANSGFTRIVINHAWLGGQIRQHLGDGSRWGVEICYSPEPPGALETGGGIVNALPLLGNTPFITVNADIYTDFDFTQFDFTTVDAIHLVLVDKNPVMGHPGDFGLLSQSRLTNTNKEYTFACIACYHPKIFTNSTHGRYSVTPLIRDYVEKNQVTGSLHRGIWFDIGSMERLRDCAR